MNKLATSVAILEHELSEIRLILERKTGLLIQTSTEQLFEIVAEHLDARRSPSAADLLDRLRSFDSECESLTERLVGDETGFFRCPAAFDSLAKVVIPELQARRAGENPHNLRVWSAGCATGEEPYSIAMSVCEAVNCSAGAWKVHIVGSDIRRHALQVAERGLYPQSSLRHVSRELMRTYFAKVGQHLLAKPRLRNLVTFTPTNLVAPTYWKVRLHLLYGCTAAFLHRPAHRVGAKAASLLGTWRLPVSGRWRKDSSDGRELQLSQERGLRLVSKTAGCGSEGREVERDFHFRQTKILWFSIP